MTLHRALRQAEEKEGILKLKTRLEWFRQKGLGVK